MHTDEAVKQLKPYLIGDLTPKEQAVLEGHLDVNEAARWHHARAYRQLLPVLKQPEHEPSPGVDAALFIKARKMIAEGTEVQPRWWQTVGRELWGYRVGFAAVVLTGGLVFALVAYGGSKTGQAPMGTWTLADNGVNAPEEISQLKSNQRISVPEGRSAIVRLTSGATIQFTPGSGAVLRHIAKTTKDGRDRTVVALERGGALVDTGAPRDVDNAPDVEISADGYSAVVPSAGRHSLVSVRYAGPRSEVTVRGPGVVDVDLERETLGGALALAEKFGKHATVDEKLSDALGRQFVDMRKRGMTWADYTEALKEFHVDAVTGAGNTVQFKALDGTDGNAGPKYWSSYFQVSVLDGLALVSPEKGADPKPVLAHSNANDAPVQRVTLKQTGRGGSRELDPGSSPARQVIGDVSRQFLVSGANSAASTQLLAMFDETAQATMIKAPIVVKDASVWTTIDDHEVLIAVGDRIKIPGTGKDGKVVSADANGIRIVEADGTPHLIRSGS
jgi:hypothetical protein